MNSKILVDSDNFWYSLNDDIQLSQDYIYLQTLSFEGDSVGFKLCDSLFSSSASDKKILVDPYIKVMLSDKFVYSPKNRLDAEFREEIKATSQMISNLNNNGIPIKFTGSSGSIFRKILHHDHKKLIVIDDRITYLGGINFCDHNFLWHDMMLRIEDSEITKFLKNDFLASWNGESICAHESFHDLTLHILNGRSNENGFKSIINLIEQAQKSIYVISPYITFPFSQKLKEVSNNGIEVVLITPESNNKKFIKNYILWEFANTNVKLKLYQKNMSHLKAMIIDDEFLIVGSSNFDLISYRIQKEIVAVITDKTVISEFIEKVLQKDLDNSTSLETNGKYIKGYFNNIALRFVDRICSYQSKK